MSDLEKINLALRKTAGRRRWFRAWNGLFSGLFVAALVWLMGTVLFKVLPLPIEIFSGLAIFSVLALVMGFFWGARRLDSSLETARWVDQQLGLKEKLSAAVEFSSSSGKWGKVLVQDGVRYLDRVQPARLLQYKLPELARWTVLLLFLSATLGFVPEYRSEKYRMDQREEAVIQETGQQLESFAKRTLKQRPPAMKPTEKAMLSVEELGRQLTSAKITRADALDRIASVSDKLKDEAKNLGENPAFKRMRQEARQPSGAPASTAKALQKQIESLQQKMKSGANDPAGLEKMKNRLNQIQRAAAGMNADDAGLSPEMKQQMAESMASLSQMAKSAGLSMPDLEDALSALKNGDLNQFMKSLDSAHVDLDKMLDMAKSMKQLQMDLAKAGKDLGEQLEKGQAQAAHNRLMDMISKLDSGEVAPKDLAKMMAEVSEAIKPAGDYGNVQDLLKKALSEGQKGDSQATASSLKAAADELKKLMDQFGDMESLMATLETLQKAQMCVGNCMGWGQCNSKMAGFKPGGKPGRGVGTWGDENSGWFYFPPSADRWDNSGIEQPDMDPRGHTDRGQAELANGMVPTKVKGNFSPGGPMPSITLKGLSIKGESRVNIEEAITAAQGEAQSALSQQKVPRAYQQSVRDYFDDFSQ